MTYLLLALFVIGAKTVIDYLCMHYSIGTDRLYEVGPFRNRPQSPFWWRTLSKPLYYCNVCMSSVWGTWGYWLIGWEDWQGWMLHVIVCAALVMIYNTLIDYLFDLTDE